MKLTTPIRIAVTGTNIITSAASASGAIPINAAATRRFIRVAASAAAYIRVGTGAQTAVSTDMMVQPGDAVILDVTNMDTIAALQVAAAGVVVATPVEM